MPANASVALRMSVAVACCSQLAADTVATCLAGGEAVAERGLDAAGDRVPLVVAGGANVHLARHLHRRLHLERDLRHTAAGQQPCSRVLLSLLL